MWNRHTLLIEQVKDALPLLIFVPAIRLTALLPQPQKRTTCDETLVRDDDALLLCDIVDSKRERNGAIFEVYWDD